MLKFICLFLPIAFVLIFAIAILTVVWGAAVGAGWVFKRIEQATNSVWHLLDGMGAYAFNWTLE